MPATRLLRRGDWSDLAGRELVRRLNAAADDVPPARFSEPFLKVMGLAIDQGLVSVRRMAGLLGVTRT